MSIVVDIEDLAVGSSFFSETEVLMANEMPVEEKQLIHRFLQMKISNVKREYIGVGPLAGRTQVILSCLQSVTQKPVTILLRDLWIECDYRPGTIVSVLPYSEAGEILIDGSNGAMLAYDPTNLISITTVADAVSCLRKATLSVKMQPASCDNRPTLSLVSGTVAHDVFEQGIRDPRLLEDLTALIRAAISGNLPTIYACGEDEVGVQQAVCEILRGFPIWCSKYLRERPFADAHVIDELRANMPENSRNISIPHVYSLEESITVPGLGLKGKLDAVVMLRYGSSSGWESILVPLELKTGKSTSSTAHRAQTLLYTILLSERYDLPVNFGLLYYVASDVLLRVAATDVELQALMMTRNRLAAACQTETLPKPISNPNACKYCAQIENCMTMMRLNKEEHQVNEVLAEKAKDFAVISDDSFYRHWMQLVDLEQAETLGDGGNKASSIQGAQLYRCGGIGGVGVFGRWLAEFDISPTLMTSSELAEGDPVSIYLERDTVHEVAIGLIQRIDAKSIVVGCDRDVGTILQRSADFCPKSNQRLVHVSSASLRFTIVKSEMLSGFALSRTNIVRLYAKRLTMHRELISGLRAPTFVDDLVVTKSAELDDDQNEAIRHCLAAKEYALLLGMPGTGKTTTIVALIKALVGDNKRVLVSSYTHSAVDNLLTKVSSSGLTVLRFGNADRIDPRLQNRLFSAQNFPSVKAMRDAINSTLVFGTTCLGVNHPALATVNFDYCIVDEASQITVPAALGPILMAPRFILVGDHYQLPPLVKSRQAQSLGLHVSLFKILAERHPYTVAILRKQYRMNEDIQLITNRTVYNGQLECGSLQVRDAVLNIAKSAIDSLFCGVCSDSPNCWIRYVLQPACRVCFLDTDLVPAWETVVGMSFSNVGEAHIIGSIINAALSGGLKEQQLCVISAFRPQIKLLAGQLPAEIEVSTVDRYQGRDKDCVILSFVRSNAEHYIGTLLCDWYRLNVAFTRARHKLLMVGSWSTLMDHEQLYILRDMILEQGWYYQLPPNAHHHDIL
jgi:DNA replication ATP-dependent helicase Dna2